MVKANELRIGNILYSNLTERNFICNSEDIYNLSMNYNANNANYVKLTEEWLLKAGFEKSFKNDYWYSIRIGDKRLLISILGNIEIEKWDRTMIGFLSICEYVHKLQNLYFALVGEELVFSTEP